MKRRCSWTPKPSTELQDSSRATRQRVGTGARRSAAQPHPNKIGPAGAPASPPAALSLSWMDCMGVDWPPCASKQGQIVRIALREQGAGEARRRCKISSW